MSDGGDFLRRLVALLDRALIPHMIAGSFASTWPSGLLAVDVILG